MRKTLDQFEKELFGLYGSEYTVLGNYETNKTPILIRHNNCGNDWDVRPNDVLRGKRCPICSRKKVSEAKRLTDSEYRTRIADTNNDFLQLSNYKGADEKIRFKHVECGREFEMRAKDFEIRKTCSYCGKEKCGWNRRLTHEEFVSKLPDDVNDAYEFLTEYVNSRTLIKTKKKVCGHINFFMPYDLKISNDSCALCSSSKGERRIRAILKEEGALFEEQYTFEECRAKRALPFDFAILDEKRDIKILIEFDGEQHFRNIESWGGVPAFQATKKNDLIKNQYCRKNRIKLVRIRYDEFGQLNKTIKTLLK